MNEFINVAQKINFFELEEYSDITYKIKEKKYLIPWKRFSEIYVATFTGEASEEYQELWQVVDWDFYNRNLGWWRNVNELILLKNSNANQL